MASALLAKPTRALSGVSRARASRSRTVAVRAESRPTWYPGATPPKHLDGSLLGDYGFDPLRLGENKETLNYFREGELTNGRWAMAAVVGILFTEAVGLPKWWLAGAESYALDFAPLLAIELAIFAVLEYKRYEGYKKTGETGFLAFFPFDPLGLKSEETKLKELKNGRLAMLAWLGFSSQAAVRGMGPIESLQFHLADPGKNNIFTSSVGNEATVAVVALCIAPFIVDTTKFLGGEQKTRYPWTSE